VRRDKNGTHYTVPSEGVEFPEVTIWWSRGARKRVNGRTEMPEYLCMKQENGDDRADVILLTPGQVYDALDAFTKATERP
jgi:hypothetical protein